MDQLLSFVLTPYNYFDEKSKMTIYLKKQRLHRVIIGFEIKPTLILGKPKWFNKLDEAFGT